MDNSQIIDVLEKELAVIKKEMAKPSGLSISLEKAKYWVCRKYDILKQIEIDSEKETFPNQYLNNQLIFAEEEIRLASKESLRIIECSQHLGRSLWQVMKYIKDAKEAING